VNLSLQQTHFFYSSHFLESITGLATIRAFNWIDSSIDVSNRLLDTSQRPVYLLAMIQQWLTSILNFAVATLAVILITLATQLHASSGFTSAALISLMTLSDMLASIVRNWTQLETSISAVSRLKSFSATVKNENFDDETETPPEEWPQFGKIKINNVSASYR
jgi:ATP-binding cassette subfamily C (CFTR/MRP) protein 1